MVTQRKACAYSKRKPVKNTRISKRMSKSYVKAAPPQKVVKFNLGDSKGAEEGKYNLVIALVSDENVQIRDIALEATRQSLNKDVAKLLQKNFFMRVNAYPHNVLRNNRVFSGGSKGERIQTGMSKSFGSPEGRAAVIKKGKSIMTVFFAGEENIPKIRAFFVKVKPKVPGRTLISFKRLERENNLDTSEENAEEKNLEVDQIKNPSG